MEKGLERMTNRGSAELPKRDRPPVWSRLTVRGWVVLVLGLMIAWVIVASIVGARSLGRTAEVSNYLRDVIQPAEIEAQRLQGALLNQETGARDTSLQPIRPCWSPMKQAARKRLAHLMRSGH